jgi:hypothetical protein
MTMNIYRVCYSRFFVMNLHAPGGFATPTAGGIKESRFDETGTEPLPT